jgi:TolB protein
MRKLIVGSLAAALLCAAGAMPAAARPLGHNGQIAFFRDDPAVGHRIYTVNPDGSRERQVLPVGLDFPRWSPDGSAIVAGLVDGSAAWIIDPDTGAHRALPNPDPDRFAVFACGAPSPDFERLACGGFGTNGLNGIYTVRTSDGGGLQQLTSTQFEDPVGDYSPDGSQLVHAHWAPDDSAGLYVLRTNGSGTRRIFAGAFPSGGSWSPKGNDVVFSWRPNFDVHSSLWIVHSNGSGLHRVATPEGFCGGPVADLDARGCADPVWSPDGRKILFRHTTPGRGEGGDLYTVNPCGTGLFQVTHDGDVESPDWGTHPLAT